MVPMVPIERHFHEKKIETIILFGLGSVCIMMLMVHQCKFVTICCLMFDESRKGENETHSEPTASKRDVLWLVYFIWTHGQSSYRRHHSSGKRIVVRRFGFDMMRSSYCTPPSLSLSIYGCVANYEWNRFALFHNFATCCRPALQCLVPTPHCTQYNTVVRKHAERLLCHKILKILMSHVEERKRNFPGAKCTRQHT